MNAARVTYPSGLRRAMITICVMSATIMQVLDTTVANVALPYMQGSLSASLDQVGWILTSYIVASAIMTAPVGWLADRFGRKRLFLACTIGFTVASVLCGLAATIEQMVVFRLLQGFCGAGLIPLSQAVMLDSYPPEDRAYAMSIWGVGVMLGPIMGPTIGGWLTETYSWHWVFLINLPIGLVTFAGLVVFMDETDQRAQLRFDWTGFLALAVGIGALQLMLDRGEQLGWFGSTEIVVEAVLACVGFYYFFAHSLTTRHPFVRFELFKDRNFAGGCILMFALGAVTMSTMALSTQFIQNVMGYPVLSAGYMMGSRGLGTMIGMIAASRLLKRFEARNIMFVGMGMVATSMHEMIGFTNMTSSSTVIWVSTLQGLGLGLVFAPLSTANFATLPGPLRTEGAAISTLLRNVGNSIGIPMVISVLVHSTSVNHAQFAEQVTPFNDAMRMPDAVRTFDLATDIGRALFDNYITQQATIIGYSNAFTLLMILTLISVPLLFAIGSTRMLRRASPVPAE